LHGADKRERIIRLQAEALAEVRWQESGPFAGRADVVLMLQIQEAVVAVPRQEIQRTEIILQQFSHSLEPLLLLAVAMAGTLHR
jgi:hypothetical protein